MTVAVQTPYQASTGNGVATVYPYQFKILSASDVAVYIDGALKTLNVDYTVSGVGNSAGGSVTFTVAPTNLAAVKIVRQMVRSRTVDYQQLGDFLTPVVNPDFDKAVLLIQDLGAQLGRSIAAPVFEPDALMTLPAKAVRANTFPHFNANGDIETAVSIGSTALSQSIIGSFLYPQTAAEITAAVVPTNYYYPPGDVRRYGAIGDGVTICNTAFQNACNVAAVQGTTVYIPGAASFYKITSAIAVTGGMNICGDTISSMVRFFNCNGFNIAAGINNVLIERLQLFSVDAGGVPDPKTKTGIQCAGTNGSHCNYITTRDLFLRGWLICMDWQYTWNAVADNVSTINCDGSLRLFGQSVNNFVSSCDFVANTGTYSIKTQKDVAVQGEGLMVVNTLMASGVSGIISDGFLSLSVANCTIDLISNTGLDLTNCLAATITNSWIYAANFGVHFQDLGVAQDQYATVAGCRIQVTAANAKGIRVGGVNSGVSIIGGAIIGGPSGSGRCIYVETNATDVCCMGVQLINAGPNPAIFVGGSGFRQAGNIGDQSVQYLTPDQFTGTLTQCTTAPTAQIVYSVIGDLVILQIPSLAATSANANQPTITGLPAAIRPLTQQWCVGHVVNNSAAITSAVVVDGTGVLILFNGESTVFTAANSKGINPSTIMYRKN
jgi:hypothetical protein